MGDQTRLDDVDGTDAGELELTSPPARKPRARGGVTIRLDDETDARVDRYLEQFCRANPGIRPQRRDILVNLIHRGLEAAGLEQLVPCPITGAVPLDKLSDAQLREMADRLGVVFDDDPTRQQMIAALEVAL